MTKVERYIAVAAIALIAINGTVLFKQMQNDDEVLEIKTQIRDVKTGQEQIIRRVEKVEKVVLVKTKQQVAMTAKELDCLAKNIYYEAGVEDKAGKVAVAQVTVNRLKEGRWGKDVCKVVYAKSQFSWTLDKKKRNAQPKGELWQASLAVAKEFQKGVRVKGLEDSQYYHADYIRDPKWAQAKKVVKQIGQHIFYKG
jgi:spore germination cell wall hydrolase CwlJ-like protein